MPGRYGGSSGWILIDGYNLTAAKLQALRHKVINVTEPSGGIGDSWGEHAPVGIRQAELAADGGFFNTATGNSHEALKDGTAATPQTAPRIVVFGLAGNVIGRPCVGYEGVTQIEYEVLAERDKLQRANAAYQISGKLEDAVVLHALGAETADANTEGAGSVDHTLEEAGSSVAIVSSSVAVASVITTSAPHRLQTGDTVLIAGHTGSTPSINGERTATVLTPTTFTIPVNVSVGGTGGSFLPAKTNNGGAGFLQMTALTLGGHTAAAVTIRDSDDDSTYVDLVTFTPRTTIGAERVVVAGAVGRYLAHAIDFTGAGSPSATYLAAFSRY